MRTISIALFLALASTGTAAVAADDAAAAAPGALIFKQKCQMCHVTAPGAAGVLAPNLRGLPNRPAASTAYAYSPALKKSGLRWTAANLDAFLAAPGKLVPGTRMIVAVPDPQKRAPLVAYLMTLK